MLWQLWWQQRAEESKREVEHMYKIKDIGRFETLPPLAHAIYDGDANRVRELLAQGEQRLNDPIALSRHTELRPLELALVLDKLGVTELLVELGAELNHRDSPSFLLAARYGGEQTMRYLLAHGADPAMKNRLRSNAYSQAYYGNKKNLALLPEMGLSACDYGGAVLRTAASSHDPKTVELMLELGADVNYNEADQVYPYRATPLTAAARADDVRMVKLLLDRGADPTITETDGERAYTIAVVNGNQELAELLKALEPSDFHELSNKRHALKPYKLPEAMAEVLLGEELRLDLDRLADSELEVGWVRLLPYTDTIELKHGRQKLLRFTAEIDNYSHVHLVWNPSKRLVGYYDIEHKEYGNLCKWDAFMADPGKAVRAAVTGEPMQDGAGA